MVFCNHVGINSTWNFIKSLGTSQGWKNLGNGLLDTMHMANQYSARGMYLRTQVGKAIGNYIDNIPNMSAYEIGYDVGFVTEKVVETIALSKGAGLIGNSIRGGSVAARGVTNVIPKGKLANHLFKGANKLADTPANRALIQKISNGKPLGVDQYGKSWFAKTLDNGTQIYTYTRNGVVKGAGINQTPVDIIARYNLK